MLGNAQYSRRECLDIVDTSSKVKEERLGKSAVRIFNKLGGSIDADQIEACH